jgi:hypothetical protein
VANPSQAVQRFWHLYSNQSPSTYNADVTFTFPSSEDPTGGIGALIKMQRYKIATHEWADALPGQTFNSGSPRTVTVPGITGFSWWGGGNDGTNPLPIELVDFKAACDNNTVTLNWTTATEINNDYFTIQRSADLVDFENVAVVDGAGNSNVYINYTAKDHYPLAGTSYYRLMQTDYNGQFEIFSPITVSCVTGDNDVINIYPNPANDKLNVTMQLSSSDRGRIVIYNHFGQMVESLFVEPNAGYNTYSFDLNNLAQGQYMVSFMMEGKVLPTQKVIISR